MAEPQLIQCSVCGAVNRVPREKLSQGMAPVCGRCKSPLSESSKPVHVTDANFAAVVEQSSLPVLVDLWAPWCGPCRTMTPVIDSLASELAGKVRVGKLNVDENPVTASRFQVQSIPSLLIFQNGREVDRMVGALPKAEISRRLQRVLS